MPYNRTIIQSKSKCLFRIAIGLFFYYYLIVKPIGNINDNLTLPKKSDYMTRQQRKFLEFLSDHRLNSKLIKSAPTKYLSSIEQRNFDFIQVYLISQQRNKLYEEKLRDVLGIHAPIRVFYAEQQKNETSSTDLFDVDYIDFAQHIQIKAYTAVDAKDWELGIHDLLDKFNELRNIEIIQYETKDANDSIIFSIIRHGIAHYLLHLKSCNNSALQYVIKRFIFNMYYPFSIIYGKSRKNEEPECFISFIQKFSFNRYYFSGTRKSLLNKSFQ